MEILLNMTVAQQQVQVTQNDCLNFHQRLFVARKCQIRTRQKLHKQKHQQMNRLLVRFLQIDDAMQATGQILFVRTADGNIVNVAIYRFAYIM